MSENLLTFQGTVELDGDKHQAVRKVYVHEPGLGFRELVLPVHLLPSPAVDPRTPAEWGKDGIGNRLVALAILREVFTDGIAVAFGASFASWTAKNLPSSDDWSGAFSMTASQVVDVVRGFDGWTR